MRFMQNEDYYAANEGQLTEILNSANHLLDGAPEATEVRYDAGTEPTLTAGEITIDDIQNRFDVTEATAAKIAGIENDALLSAARVNLLGLRGLATMISVAERRLERKDVTDSTNPDAEDILLPYQTATWNEARWSKWMESAGSLVIARSDMRGLVDNDSDSHQIMQHQIRFEEDLTHTFFLTAYDGRLIEASYQSKPTHDELLRRCQQLFSADLGTVIALLGGHFDEDELAPILNDLWLDHQGQSTEEEVGPTLDEVRQRAINARESVELVVAHELSLPSVYTLNTLSTLLRN